MNHIEEMLSFSELKDGWDGYGSVAPSSKLVQSAIRALTFFPKMRFDPEPTVSADGLVGWFWKDDDIFLEILFTDPDVFVFYGNKDGEHIKGKCDLSYRDFPVTLSLFMERL